MQILFILTQDLNRPSGLGRYWPLAQELARLGHQVQIIALHSNFKSLKQKRIKRNGVQIHYVAPMHIIKQGSQKDYYHLHQLIWVTLRATWALSKFALSSPADMIFVGKPHPMNSIAGLLVRLLRRIPLVVDCDDYEAGSGHFTGKWQRKIVAFFEQRVPRYGNFVTTNTNFMRENLISWGVPQEKVIYLPNGVDPERFQPPSKLQVESAREKLGLLGKKVVAYIGSVSFPSHPVYLLMEAFVLVHDAMPNSVLLIVGGGENLPDLKKQAVDLGIESSTLFVGHVRPEDIPLYYALADVSVDPVHDNDAARGRSPLKMFESWICGVPFITMDVGDRAYLMGEQPAVVLVSPDTQKLLAHHILETLEDPVLSTTLIQLGKSRVQQFYWASLASLFNDHLNLG